MSLFDRSTQLTDENAILRSQLHDAQEQAKRDTETIARQRNEVEILAQACEQKNAEIRRLLDGIQGVIDKCTP